MKSGNVLVRRVLRAAILLFVATGFLEVTSFVFLYFANGHWNAKAQVQGTLIEDAELHEISAVDRSLAFMSQHVLHPYFGFVRNYQLEKHRFNNLTVDEPVNGLGFFGEYPLQQSDDNAYVVAIVGGSVALEFYLYGRGVLGGRLKENGFLDGREIRYIPLALGGMKQPQQLMVLAYMLSRGGHFDAVINIDGFNEVALPFAENRHFGVNPFFPRGWHRYAAKAIDGKTALLAGEMAMIKKHLANWGNRLSIFPLRESYTVLAIWQQYRNRLMSKGYSVEMQLREHLQKTRELSAGEAGPPYDYTSRQETIRDIVTVWKNSSIQLWKLCKENSIDYFHFLQPNQYFPDTRTLSDWEQENAVLGRDYPYRQGAEAGYPLLVAGGEELANLGVPFTDLSQIFRDRKETIYKDACCHYNETGNSILATSIAKSMRE